MTAPDLTPSQRRAVALAAEGLRCREIRARLALEHLPVPHAGLGPLWSAAAQKLGLPDESMKGRQPQLVYRAYTRGCLDLPEPDDPGPLPADLLAMLRTLTTGRTLRDHAVTMGVSLPQVEYLVRHTRRRLGDVSLAGLVYRALPQLPSGQHTTPGDGPGPDGSTPVVDSLQAELPGDLAAVAAGRDWARNVCTALGWTGPDLRAGEVAAHLTANAVHHGLPRTVPPQCHLLMRAAVTENGDLILDVTDHNPRFPRFDHERQAASGRGMRRLARLDVQLSWFPSPDGIGKTVRAILPGAKETR
ncbi:MULTISPECIES: hypothetical protein [unclassified Streptomyces]|uniref:ATP-binding protein n=1 Tax=unclassified Streptomyces TaxID=2593676 RepID=UPI000DD5B5D5|nr:MULTISPECIES: hypothetical protein [unclassified Streptomyces]QZZ25598.1 ATP-binding protein [Streptomyces sp. ST1015]